MQHSSFWSLIRHVSCRSRYSLQGESSVICLTSHLARSSVRCNPPCNSCMGIANSKWLAFYWVAILPNGWTSGCYWILPNIPSCWMFPKAKVNRNTSLMSPPDLGISIADCGMAFRCNGHSSGSWPRQGGQGHDSEPRHPKRKTVRWLMYCSSWYRNTVWESTRQHFATAVEYDENIWKHGMQKRRIDFTPW